MIISYSRIQIRSFLIPLNTDVDTHLKYMALPRRETDPHQIRPRSLGDCHTESSHSHTDARHDT